MSTKRPEDKIEFGHERYVPNAPGSNIQRQEHLTRYLFASQFVKSKVVLDAGCGTGYGSHLLSLRGTSKIIGIDNSKEAIDYCNNNYKASNLEFHIGDCTKYPFPDSSFDVAISFNVIEQLQNVPSFFSEIRRVLKDDGVLIISTINNETNELENPFHYCEYNEDEFIELLKNNFQYVDILYQTYPSTLSIGQSDQSKEIMEIDFNNQSILTKPKNILNLIGICSKNKLCDYSNKLFVLDDDSQLIREHNNLKHDLPILKKRLQNMEEQIHTLQKTIEERTLWIYDLQAQLNKKDELIRNIESKSTSSSKKRWSLFSPKPK